MPDSSCICNLYHSSRQHGILTPLSKARDRTCVLMVRQSYHGNPSYSIIWYVLIFICSTFIFQVFLFGLSFLRLHPGHMEVPRLGIQSELQLPTYTTAHSNAGSLAHWEGPGIQPVPSWILVRLVTAEPPWGTSYFSVFSLAFSSSFGICTIVTWL